ncbi:hypothetical protein D3C81_2083980 [compost metagenome]
MLFPELLDQLADFDNLLGVQTGGRLIENQQIRLMQNGLGQTQPLPVAFGQPLDDLLLSPL